MDSFLAETAFPTDCSPGAGNRAFAELGCEFGAAGGISSRRGLWLHAVDVRDSNFRPVQINLAHDQFPPQKRQEFALDPEVPSFQNWVIDRGILDAHILQMKPVPRCECDSKDGNRITEVFADYFPQLRLGIRGLNIKIDRQQSQPNETGYCDDNDKRWLNKTFHNAF